MAVIQANATDATIQTALDLDNQTTKVASAQAQLDNSQIARDRLKISTQNAGRQKFIDQAAAAKKAAESIQL